jgi:membrane protease YdiL (CAAX protease family)
MADSPDSQPGDRPMTPLWAAGWTGVLWLLENVAVQVTQAARPGALSDVVNLGACQVLATSVVVFAMVRVHARETSLRWTLGVAPLGPLPLLLSLAAGAGLYPLLSTVDEMVLKRWPYPSDDSALMEKLLDVPTLGARVALVVAAFVVMPLTRELFFRGVVFTEVRRATGLRTAVVASAVFFAASQLDWRTIPTTLVLGFALARLRERTGSVLGAVAGHLAFWSVAGIPILRGADPAADVTYSTKWIVGGAVIALLALVAVGAGRREE